MAESDIATEPEVLNIKMSEAFDWSDDKTIVRDAIWNHIMESNEHNTDETEKAMMPFLSDTDDNVRAYVEKNLKK
ncbi:hypothetical protein [Companilactobacillus ginsenosidimutans]|uniref:Uncharacterized protein n=1 Tax=Companilactobacillus ginsenosidimutans TaxID=1007676 RepID=A0A0H4QFT1_9LACO|nr:hypothetical protein [Companilactobacillus ginsenosidimutans]AKP66817.1 hypothetical protein ABM34_04035 [Companilactobacillus ginsenosidimutans]